jgi:protein SCO1/2
MDEGIGRTALASALVLFLGLLAIYTQTSGLHAFTSETLRRAEITTAPRAVPNLPVLDERGERRTLQQFLNAGDRIWLVDFVYTNCQSICSALGSSYQQLQQQIAEQGLQDRVGLLSISFDASRDDVDALRRYASRMGSNAPVWKLVTLADPQNSNLLLDGFGITVIALPDGEFEHNAAIHVVDSSARLVRIVDTGTPREALDAAIVLTYGPMPAQTR